MPDASTRNRWESGAVAREGKGEVPPMVLELALLSTLLAQLGPVLPSPPPPPPDCEGEYADSFSALSSQARAFEQAQGRYTYCVRSTATYECLSYGADGNVRRSHTTVQAHGTAFAYRQQNGETLLLTNNHVSEWPAVTDDAHPLEEVPQGCKRVSDSLRIVDNEADAYERDDIHLSRVVNDPQLDMSVLKARASLSTMPWKVGHSAALKERNVVDVRGFPLGVFNATNVGKVVSTRDHDEYKEWNHDDFVVDALLSPGNSGSPVLAISCKTGEFELVGVYHAGYSRGNALNVVVGIDQVRDLMTNLKRSPRRGAEDVSALDAEARQRLAEQVRGTRLPFFAFGSRTAAVHAREDGALVFEVLHRDFPRRVSPVLVLEDLPPAEGEDFGQLGRVWLGNERGLKERTHDELSTDEHQQLGKLLEALRGDALAAFAYRDAVPNPSDTRQAFEAKARIKKTLERAISTHKDLSEAAGDLADRLAPKPTDALARADDIYSAPKLPEPPPAVAPELTAAPGPERAEARGSPAASSP